MYQGESYTIVLNFLSPYDISIIQDIKLKIDHIVVGELYQNIIQATPSTYRCEISGNNSKSISPGEHSIFIYVKDINRITNKNIGTISIYYPHNPNTDESINLEYNIILNIDMSQNTQTQIINITI